MSTAEARVPKLVLAVLGLVALIALASQLVRTDDAATNRPTAATAEPQTKTSTAVAMPELSPVPIAPSPDLANQSPTGVPTPGGLADPTPVALVPTAEPLATNEPTQFSGAATIDAHVVVPDVGGVWIKAQRSPQEWSFVAQPPELQNIACGSVIADKMVFTARNNDRTSQHIAVLDVATQSWSVTRLPRLDEDREAQRRPDYCNGIVVDSSWVFGRAYEGYMHLAVSDDEGATFRLRSIGLPGRETPATSTPLSIRVELAAGDGRFVANLCMALSYEAACGVNVLMFPNEVVAEAETSEVEWSDSSGVMIGPSPKYDGPWLFSGMPGATGRANSGIVASPYAFEVRSVGGKLWRSELIDVQTTSTNGVEDFEAGRWAVGPVGQPTVPLPTGFRPRLFAYGDAIVAEVPIATRGPVAAAPNPQWWVLDAGATSWRQLQRSPVTDWRRLQPLAPVSVVSIDSSFTLVIPTTPPPEPAHPWDGGTGSGGGFGGQVLIAGEQLLVAGHDEAWLSPDRGATWTRTIVDDGLYLFQGRSAYPGSDCAAGGVAEAAATYRTSSTNRARALVVVSEDVAELQVLSIPTSPLRPVRTSYFSGCRPLHVNDAWLVADVDLETSLLTVTSLSPRTGTVSTHTFALPPELAQQMPAPEHFGSADLYLDDETLLIHLCVFPDDDVWCQGATLSVDIAALDTPRSSGAPETAALVSVYSSDRPEYLFQVGDRTWRSVAASVAGTFPVPELSNQPYFDWTAGPIDGPQVPVPIRELEVVEHNGQVVACGFDPDRFEGGGAFLVDQTHKCWFFDTDRWAAFLGNVAVERSTVPVGVDVTFSYRSNDGEIMVITN